MAHLHIKTFAKTLKTKTDIQVILPTPLTTEALARTLGNPYTQTYDYYSDSLSIPVLYLLHGTFGDDADWMRFSRIESYAQEYNIAVVMPNAANSSYRNMPRGGPQYYDYLTGELIEMINWMFPVSRKREDTFIAGLSMGAFGAFVIGMNNPETFSHVACMSGSYRGFSLYGDDSPWALAFSPDDNTKDTCEDCYWLASELMNKNIDCPKLYISCGTEDFLYEENLEFKKHLENIGLVHIYHEQPGIHNWNIWDDEIQRVLKWLPVNKR